MLKLSDLRSPWRVGFNWIINKICRWLGPGELKNNLYRMTGVKIGKNVWISPDCTLDPVFPELIEIRDNVFIGFDARLFSHLVYPKDGKILWRKDKILLKKNCFIGGYSTIRLGTVIGEGATVGSDSLVTKSIPDGETWIGIPAKLFKKKN